MSPWIMVYLIFAVSFGDVIDPTSAATNTENYSNSEYDSTNNFYGNTINCGSPICNIFCDETNGCYNATINARSALLINIKCSEYKSCYSMEIYSNSSTTLSIECSNNESCGYLTIYADTLQNINLNCEGSDNTCTNLQILSLPTPKPTISDILDEDGNGGDTDNYNPTWIDDNLTWILSLACVAMVACFCCALTCFWWRQQRIVEERREKRREILRVEKEKLKWVENKEKEKEENKVKRKPKRKPKPRREGRKGRKGKRGRRKEGNQRRKFKHTEEGKDDDLSRDDDNTEHSNDGMMMNENFSKWTSDDIVDWIITLDDGRFVKYEEELRYSLDVEEINGDNFMDLSVYDLSDFGVTGQDKYELIKYIKIYTETKRYQ